MKHLKKFNEAREFKVKSKMPSKSNCYEIVIEFMIGDADGDKFVKFDFPEEKMEDVEFKQYVSDFIDSINGCIKLDGNGRVGFDDVLECTQWYAGGFDRCHDQYEGVPSWSRFCKDPLEIDEDDLPLKDENEELIEMEPFQEDNNPFAYHIPSDENGFYCSYESITMYHYDSDGGKYEVEI